MKKGSSDSPVSWVICVPVRQNSGVCGRSADIIRFTVTSDELSVIKLFSSVFISSSLLPKKIINFIFIGGPNLLHYLYQWCRHHLDEGHHRYHCPRGQVQQHSLKKWFTNDIRWKFMVSHLNLSILLTLYSWQKLISPPFLLLPVLPHYYRVLTNNTARSTV